MKFDLKSAIFFLLILLFGAYLRMNNLGKNPPGFYTDEASIGFNAYKILTSGYEEHGKFMPVFFEAFGEYKTPFAIYPVVPFIAFLGSNEFSVRLAQVAFGLLDIIFIFFLAKVLWNSAVGLICAYVLATSPWHVHMSRIIFESHNAFLFFVLGGSLFLVQALKNSFLKNLIVSAGFFGISFYTYFATRIFTPLFLAGLLFFWRADFLKLLRGDAKRTFRAIFLFVLIMIPLGLHMASGKGFARFREVPITHRQNVIFSSVNLYLAHFDPRFIFIWGDSDYPGAQIVRHSVTGMGLFYKWQLPFFVIGIITLVFPLLLRMRVLSKKFQISTSDNRFGDARVVILLMLVLYPLGSVVSDTVTPYATRSYIGVIPYTLLISLGIYKAFELLRGKWFLKLALVLGVFLSSVFYLSRFLDLYGAYANRAYGYNGFQYGAREIVQYFMADQIHSIKIMDSGFDGKQAYLDFYSLGKCSGCYVSDPKPNDREIMKLLAVSVSDLRSFNERYNGTIVHKIYYPDDREAFYLFEANSK